MIAQKLKADYPFRCVVGFSDRHTVMVDFDDTSLKRVKSVAEYVCRRFRLEGFIVLKSSEGNYHVVFNRPIPDWETTLQHICFIGSITDNPEVWKWIVMQGVKGSATLRVSPKPSNPHIKPSPRIVYRYGVLDKQVKEFLAFGKLVLNVLRRIKRSYE
ncbi:MAG: hypothetical protein QXJ07_05710 [Candidatus Bathyarchaeia archaeon]